jgi:hypothetical protein
MTLKNHLRIFREVLPKARKDSMSNIPKDPEGVKVPWEWILEMEARWTLEPNPICATIIRAEVSTLPGGAGASVIPGESSSGASAPPAVHICRGTSAS